MPSGVYERTEKHRKIISACHLGLPSSRKGKTLTAETRAKIGAANKQRWKEPGQHEKMVSAFMGHHNLSSEHKKKLLIANTGRSCRSETREKISASEKGKIVSHETRIKLSAANLGKTISTETREKLHQANIGERGTNWRGGISFFPYCEKFNKDLKRRVRAYFENRCVICGKSENDNGKALSVHHISYDKMICCNDRPARFAALCHCCHSKTGHNRDRWETYLHRIIDEMYDGRSYYTKSEYSEMYINA